MNDTDKALNYYKSIVLHTRPQYVPAKVSLPLRVSGDSIFDSVSVEPGEYECNSNQWGAISVQAANGRRLGVKPCEFEVIEWRPNDSK